MTKYTQYERKVLQKMYCDTGNDNNIQIYFQYFFLFSPHFTEKQTKKKPKEYLTKITYLYTNRMLIILVFITMHICHKCLSTYTYVYIVYIAYIFISSYWFRWFENKNENKIYATIKEKKN